MNHSSSGEVLEDLEEAENPTYEAGSQAMIEADHMGGMDSTTTEIESTEETTAYMVAFPATTGGEKVVNHKWVTESERSAE